MSSIIRFHMKYLLIRLLACIYRLVLVTNVLFTELVLKSTWTFHRSALMATRYCACAVKYQFKFSADSELLLLRLAGVRFTGRLAPVKRLVS